MASSKTLITLAVLAACMALCAADATTNEMAVGGRRALKQELRGVYVGKCWYWPAKTENPCPKWWFSYCCPTDKTPPEVPDEGGCVVLGDEGGWCEDNYKTDRPLSTWCYNHFSNSCKPGF